MQGVPACRVNTLMYKQIWQREARTIVQQHEQALQGRLRGAIKGLLGRMLKRPHRKLHPCVLEPQGAARLKHARKDGL